MTHFSILVVNLNNLDFTKNCLTDLIHQDTIFNLCVIDQNSTEIGTREFLEKFKTSNLNRFPFNNIEIIFNKTNVDLNEIWNDFVEKSNTEFVCLLNNDTRISPNFLSSSKHVFDLEPEVGFVNHATNKLEFSAWDENLNYKIIEDPYRQGWDPIFRKSDYHRIPSELTFFYGDDFIYSKLYLSGKKGAYVLNSPVMHFERSTTFEKGGKRDCSLDGNFYNSMENVLHNLTFRYEFSSWKPEFNIIRYEKRI
jgi:GT2 family glycosyltransferase